MKFTQASDTSHVCHHERIELKDDNGPCLRCERCAKRWTAPVRSEVTASDEYAVLCPTCGGLPTDYSEMQRLRAALREALDGWERAETEAIRATASEAQAEIDIANSEDLARIAELRKLT